MNVIVGSAVCVVIRFVFTVLNAVKLSTLKTYYEHTIVTYACYYAINRVTLHLHLQVEFRLPLYLTSSLTSGLWPGWCCLTSFHILGSFSFNKSAKFRDGFQMTPSSPHFSFSCFDDIGSWSVAWNDDCLLSWLFT